MGCTSTTATVPIDQDWEFEYDLTRKNTDTGELEAADGASMTAHFALTSGGAAIGSTSTALTERASKAGRYFGILADSTLTTDLAAYVGQTVYEVYLVGSDEVESRRVTVVASKVK